MTHDIVLSCGLVFVTSEAEPEEDVVNTVDKVDRTDGQQNWLGDFDLTPCPIEKQRKGCIPEIELTPEQLKRRIYRRMWQRRRRAGFPRKNRPWGERTRAEQLRAAARAYYHRHREEILRKRKAQKAMRNVER